MSIMSTVVVIADSTIEMPRLLLRFFRTSMLALCFESGFSLAAARPRLSQQQISVFNETWESTFRGTPVTRCASQVLLAVG
jgi:hypothetical protein